MLVTKLEYELNEAAKLTETRKTANDSMNKRRKAHFAGDEIEIFSSHAFLTN